MNVSKFDLVAAGVAAVLVTLLALFFNRTRIGRALRAVADDHQAALAVGIPLQQIWAHRVGRGRRRRAGRRPAVGRAQRRSVRADLRRAEGAAGADPRRLRVDPRRDRRRPHHRRVGKARRSLPRPVCRRRHRRLVPVRARARCSCWSGPRACSAKRSSAASDAESCRSRHVLPRSRPVQDVYNADAAIFPIRQDRIAIARIALIAFVAIPLFATPYVVHRNPDSRSSSSRSRRSGSTS